MNRVRVAIWLFGAVCVLSLAAALLPMFRGESLNLTFLALAILWFIIAIATAWKSGITRKTPPAA